MSRVEAAKRLTNRWNEQVLMFPMMAQDISLSLYIRVNLRTVMRGGLLNDYKEPTK
jgi:hypothetical protein